MTPTEEEHLTRRLLRIEKQLAELQAGLDRGTTLKAPFSILGRGGRPILQVTEDQTGTVDLVLRPRKGAAVLLRITENGRSTLALPRGTLAIHDADGKTVLARVTGGKAGGEITVANHAGEEIAALEVSEVNDAGHIVLYTADGKPALLACVAEDGFGYFQPPAFRDFEQYEDRTQDEEED